MKKFLLGVIASLCLPVAYGQTTISQVQDGAAYTNDVAQGSVFVVKGTGLSGPGFTQAAAPNYPAVLNNVQITFTPAAGGAATQALMVYNFNENGVNQLAAVLPSNVATGSYNVRVVNGATTSAPVQVNVVARKPGIVTASGNGAGIAQATLGGGATLQRFLDVGRIGNFDTRAARRNDRLDLWGTGLGPDRAADTGGSSGDQTAAGNIRVLVDGQEVTPLYAGRSQGFPGLDQIVLNLPSNAPLGCFVTVQVRAGGVLSNRVTISISDGGACVDANLSVDAARKLSLGGTLTAGSITVASTGTEIPGISVGGFTLPPSTTFSEAIAGAFVAYTADTYLDSGFAQSTGACYVYRRIGGLNEVGLGLPPRSLDAGATLTATRPDNSTLTLTRVGAGTYSATIGTGTGTARTLAPGTYRIAGNGGADVGPFTSQVTVPTFTWTNKAAVTVINRGTPLAINWNGGGTGLVTVSGYSGRSISGSGTSAILDVGLFSCTARASAGTLTVPTSILQTLSAVTFDPLALAGSNFSIGVLSVSANQDDQSGRFTAPLRAGGSLDFGVFGYAVGDSKLIDVR